MEKLLLGIDVGTSACKAAVFTLDGEVLSQATVPWQVYYPAPGWVEQNPDEWWAGVCQAVRQAVSAGGFSKEQIAGVGIDGQSWSAIPVGKDGRALHNTPIWMDTRAAGIARETTWRVGFERIFEKCGNALEPTYSTAKMIWFRRTKPDVYKDTRMFLQSNSFIVLRLTGRYTQDLSQGYGVHGFDMKAGRWDDAFCEEIGVERDKLPELFACHDVVGEVTREAAEATGLACGTPVVAGGLDACCGSLGAGVYLPGQTQEQGGTSGGMSICVDTPVFHPKLIFGFHVVPGEWMLQGGTTGGGGCLGWFRRELGAAEEAHAAASGENPFELFNHEAESVPPGSGGLIYLPYMSGERSPLWDRHAKGVFFGLGYEKTRAHMVRAVMEGAAFSLEHNLRTAYETGVTVDSLNTMGGAAASLVWTQIKSDVTGKTIRVPASGTASTLGAAMLAGVGTGLYSGFGEAVSRTVRITRTHEPDETRHRLYMQYYDVYRELYEKTKELMEKIDSIQSV